MSCVVLAAVAVLQGCVPLVVAGVGTSVVATIDRRSYGAQLEDVEIQRRFGAQVSDALAAKTNVSATSYNRWVLLTGQAIDDASRAQIEQIARGIPNVREVINQITIGYPSSFATRANDALITSNIKALMVNRKDIAPNNVKIVTESNVVYLMGLVTESEANAAVEVARTGSGVSRVVRVFEIISDDEAKRLSPPSTPPPQGDKSSNPN
ncbi:MAG TPA: BON domain-containing protein [Rhodocyclaceae bacterium]|nr:BON domain-containing protein [Rhodocyclaceae bacterium]